MAPSDSIIRVGKPMWDLLSTCTGILLVDLIFFCTGPGSYSAVPKKLAEIMMMEALQGLTLTVKSEPVGTFLVQQLGTNNYCTIGSL